METPRPEPPRSHERADDQAANGPAAEPASPWLAPGESGATSRRGLSRGEAAQQVSWVYRQGDEVWVYRWRGSAAADRAAAEVARLRAAIGVALPPAAQDGASPPAASFRWTWLLIGVLTGLLLGALLVYFLTLGAAGGAEPTSLVGGAGVVLGLVRFGARPAPRPALARRVAAAFWAGLTIYVLGWALLGDPALVALDLPIAGVLATLSQLASLLCVLVGVKWLYDALGTTIVAEAGPFLTVFSGTVGAAIAILLFLRGTGQVLAGTDLDSLTFTIATLVASVASLILADLSASVTIALYGATQSAVDVERVVAGDPRVLTLVVVYVLVVYTWGLAVLVTLLGGSLVRPPAARSADVHARLGDLTLRWRSE